MKVIVQIPCFNEASTLPAVLQDLPKRIIGVDCLETLVIDDGSSDSTAAVALAAGVDHVIRHKHNRGLAATFVTGIHACDRLDADIVVNTDGDHQYPGQFIPTLLEPILKGRADIVVGDRRPVSDPRLNPVKRGLHRLGQWVISTLAGQRLADPVSGFRAYSREAIGRTHLVTDYSYTIESLLQAVRKGLAIEFVPIQTNRVTRPSRLFPSVHHFVRRSAVTTLRVAFMHHPIGVFLTIGMILLTIGTLPILRFLVLLAVNGGQGHLQSLVLGGTLIVLAAIALAAGMIAELIGHNRRMIESILEHSADSNPDRVTQTLMDTATSRPVGFSAFQPPLTGGRKGFTLIELLMVIAVTAVAMAILLPAIGSVRQSARTVQCGNHLRQLALGIANHESNLRHLPSAGWGKRWSGLAGVGTGRHQPGGWIYQVLPYIEQESVHRLGGTLVAHQSGNDERLRTPLALLHCPGRRGADLYANQWGWQPRFHATEPRVARNDYAACGGGRLIAFGDGPADFTDAAKFPWPSMQNNTGICFQRSELRLSGIVDGLSQTLMIGEKQLPWTRYDDGKDRGDNEGAYAGDDRDTIRYVGTRSDRRYQPMPDTVLAGVEGAVFGSAHPAGLQIATCDGAVRMLTYQIDLDTFADLGSRSGHHGNL